MMNTPAGRRRDALRRVVTVNDALRIGTAALRRPPHELEARDWHDLGARFARCADHLTRLADQCHRNANTAPERTA